MEPSPQPHKHPQQSHDPHRYDEEILGRFVSDRLPSTRRALKLIQERDLRDEHLLPALIAVAVKCDPKLTPLAVAVIESQFGARGVQQLVAVGNYILRAQNLSREEAAALERPVFHPQSGVTIETTLSFSKLPARPFFQLQFRDESLTVHADAVSLLYTLNVLRYVEDDRARRELVELAQSVVKLGAAVANARFNRTGREYPFTAAQCILSRQSEPNLSAPDAALPSREEIDERVAEARMAWGIAGLLLERAYPGVPLPILRQIAEKPQTSLGVRMLRNLFTDERVKELRRAGAADVYRAGRLSDEEAHFEETVKKLFGEGPEELAIRHKLALARLSSLWRKGDVATFEAEAMAAGINLEDSERFHELAAVCTTERQLAFASKLWGFTPELIVQFFPLRRQATNLIEVGIGRQHAAFAELPEYLRGTAGTRAAAAIEKALEPIAGKRPVTEKQIEILRNQLPELSESSIAERVRTSTRARKVIEELRHELIYRELSERTGISRAALARMVPTYEAARAAKQYLLYLAERASNSS